MTTEVERSPLLTRARTNHRLLRKLVHIHKYTTTGDNLYTYTKTCPCGKTKTIRRNM
jgi:hypothetical protein